jgi:hypothetical protein
MAVLPTGIGPVTGGYQIERSLRFNSADSAYLNRTPASASNRKTWTWSGWVKRSAMGATQYIFSANYASSQLHASLWFNASNNLQFTGGTVGVSNDFNLTTTQVFRDVSAWYMIMLAVDSTQATSTNRIKLYVNGVQVTDFSTATYPAQNYDFSINNNVVHRIGTHTASADYLNGYLTETNFIDGQALTPSSFGETDASTGVWKPKAFSGTYGTNGFFLKFADNSGTTSTTLGKDTSGNGNNWTPNNFSVTAGAGNDSLVDTPTSYGTDTGVGGEVRGNYATLNPLAVTYGTSFSNGNLKVLLNGANASIATSTIAVSSGKWYAEMLVESTNAGARTYPLFGICNPRTFGDASFLGDAADEYSYSCDGFKTNNNTATSVGTTLTTNDIMMLAFDADSGKIWWGKNGTWIASGNPATGANAMYSSIPSSTYVLAVCGFTSTNATVNFGQRAFAYTAPSGFKALCTQNLPTPTIGATSTTQANDYMNVVLYTGTGSSLGVTGVGFQPDWTWIKGRSGATDHGLYDAVRGVQKQLKSNTSTAETTETTGLTAFGTDGFTVGALAQLNTSSATYVAWNWKANGAGSSNTAGTITSTVSANTTSGFSIVTYTGTGANATVGHGLGVAPSMIIGKRRSGIADWMVGHSGVNGGTNPFNYYMLLNTAAAQAADSTAWQNTAPTSTVFYLGSGGNVNSNGATNVMYCFAPVAGYSAFGSYVGNGASTDGTFVYTGFRPRFVMIKGSSGVASSPWIMLDTQRDSYNVTGLTIFGDSSNAEFDRRSNPGYIDILSNGIKMRDSSSGVNQNATTYIYAAFAESPFKYSLAR